MSSSPHGGRDDMTVAGGVKGSEEGMEHAVGDGRGSPGRFGRGAGGPFHGKAKAEFSVLRDPGKAAVDLLLFLDSREGRADGRGGLIRHEEVGDEGGEGFLSGGPWGKVVGPAEGDVGDDFALILVPGALREGVLEEQSTDLGDAREWNGRHDCL